MFDPWVGRRRGKTGNAIGGRRLMVLGESHYGDPARPDEVETCIPDMTRWVVETLALEGSGGFFRNLTQLIVGRPDRDLSAAEREAIWHSIVFYNYIPVIVAVEARVAPSKKMFDAGREPFFRVLGTRKPEAIIVCGHRLWRPLLKGIPDDLEDHAYDQPFRRIGPAIAARMKHPSSWGFRPAEEHGRVTTELLARVDEARFAAAT